MRRVADSAYEYESFEQYGSESPEAFCEMRLQFQVLTRWEMSSPIVASPGTKMEAKMKNKVCNGPLDARLLNMI